MKNTILRIVAIGGLAAVGLTPSAMRAETVKDREGAVRADKAKMENDARWIFNDIDKGMAQAKKTGRPLLVTLRCVPCMSCMGIDAGILSSDELAPLLDKFVCVRVINANTLDLKIFQFDYDLSFSTLFLNADGTIYGRFGSWKHQRDPQDASLAGYKASLSSALKIHEGYPGNKAALAGKQGGPAVFKTPVEIPTLAGKYGRELDWQGKVVQSCVHCHQIGDAFRASYRSQGKPIPADLIYPMPAPDTIGLRLDASAAAKVLDVAPGSAAAAAGLKAGDELVSVMGQPLVSVADVAWALHRFPEQGELKIRVLRDGREQDLSVMLATGWRQKTDISTRVGTWSMRAMATGGMVLVDLTDAERAERGLGLDKLALRVKFVGQYGAHAAAKKAGFLKDDVIVAFQGAPRRMSESEFIGHMLATHSAKAQYKATVLRGKDRVDLTLPLQ